jgi:hypothetical protein
LPSRRGCWLRLLYGEVPHRAGANNWPGLQTAAQLLRLRWKTGCMYEAVRAQNSGCYIYTCLLDTQIISNIQAHQTSCSSCSGCSCLQVSFYYPVY